MDGTKKAVIYCRVSTKEQVEEGNSLATQEKICREYAIKNGYTVVQSFIELGESAKTADRTELKKLLAFCTTKKEQISALIIYRIDRLSRQVEDYAYIKSKLKKHGVQIKSTAEHFEDNPAGRFMENIIANVAQLDNDIRAERSINGMRDAVSEDGRYVWKAPFGYTNAKVNGKSNIIPNEHAPIIQEIFHEMAKGNVPAQIVLRNINKKWGSADKQIIPKSHFYRLIKNELYAGWIEKFDGRFKGSYEPLVSQEMFDEVQYQLSKRQHITFGYKRMHPDFPLRKLFRHPDGKALAGAWSVGKNKRYAYYFYRLPKHIYPIEEVERLFVSIMKEYQMPEYVNHCLYKLFSDHLENKTSASKKATEYYDNRIEQLNENQHALIDKNLKGILPDNLLKEQLINLEKEISEAKHQAFLANQQNVPKTTLNRFLKHISEHLVEVWKNAHYKGKIGIQGVLFPKGIIWDGLKWRTPEMSCLLTTKSIINEFHSRNVNQAFSTANTPETSQSPLRDLSELITQPLLDSLQKELMELQEIVSDGNREMP